MRSPPVGTAQTRAQAKLKLTPRQAREVHRRASKRGVTPAQLRGKILDFFDPKNAYLVSTGGGPGPVGRVGPKGGKFAAVTTGKPVKSKTVGKITRNMIRDAIDLPANTVTSTYQVGKAAVTGHPVKAVKMLADPVVQTIEHPVKSFEEHPLNTYLIGRGAKGAVGHGAGKVMRTGAVGKTAKRAASTAREPKVIPGSKRVVRRQYSKDVITKGRQVAMERRRAKRRVERGEDPRDTASPKDIARAVDEDVAAAKIVTANNQSRVADEARDAVAPRKGRVRGRRKPNAAVSLAAQGITDGTKADLARYLDEVKAAEPKLSGARLADNKQTQALIEKALEDFDPVEVRRAATAYQAHRASLDAEVVGRGLVDERVATDTRLTASRVRRPKVKKSPITAAKKKAAGEAKAAKRELRTAEAEFEKAHTAAQAAREKFGGVPPHEHDALLRAIDRRDTARVRYDEAKARALDTKAAETRDRHLAPGEEPAYVSHQPIESRTPALPTSPVKIPVKRQRKGAAVREGTLDAHPAKLIEQSVNTQRMIDAADARARFFEDYAYRKAPDRDVARFTNSSGAQNYIRKNLDESKWEAVRRDDGQYSVMPREVMDRARAHESKANAQGKLLSATGAQWRRNVLAFSPRWFVGNQLEGALRSVIAGAGPHSYATARRVLRELDPETRAQVKARTVGGGNYESAARVSADRIIRRDPSAEHLGRLATALYKLREKPGVRHLADAYGAYTDIVFRSLNGRLETQFQTAMLGKALRDHPLMSDRVRKLSKEAVREAAEGLKDTATQAELGRLVDDMYGRYGKFSPGLRSAISNYTPFAAWTINATRFLAVVLPRDHPVLTGLLASANEATDEWRKSVGLYYDPFGEKSTPGQLPPYLQGSIPGKNGSHLRLSRYAPFGLFNSGVEPGNPLEGFTGLLLPQFSEMIANVRGEDWKGKSLAENPTVARDMVAVAASFLEGQIPLASQAAQVTGVKLPNEADVKNREVESFSDRMQKTWLPFEYTPASKYGRRKKKVRVRSSSSNSSSSSASDGGFDFSGATSGASSGGFDFSGAGSGGGGW